jgi:hypothetical protein
MQIYFHVPPNTSMVWCTSINYVMVVWRPSALNQALAEQRRPRQPQRPLVHAPLVTAYVLQATRQPCRSHQCGIVVLEEKPT